MKALVFALLLAGCSKPDEAPRRTEPWLADPSASSSSAAARPRRFHFTSESLLRFSLPSRKARPGGSVTVSGGELLFDPRRPEQSRASIEVDLTKLTIDESTLPEGAELGGRSASALGLDWLELGADVPRERRDQFAKARFELASVDNLSAPTLGLDARTKRVRASVVGTLLLHGFRAPVRSDVWLELQQSAEAGRMRLSIRSATPLVVPLAPHEITARSASGRVDPLAAARAAEWVGNSVRIELDLVAEADPEKASHK